MKSFMCPYKGACFGKDDLRNICRILDDCPDSDTCPFQKPHDNITNGKVYPYNKSCTSDGCQDFEPRPKEAWAVEWDIVTGKLMGR